MNAVERLQYLNDRVDELNEKVVHARDEKTRESLIRDLNEAKNNLKKNKILLS